MADLAFLALRKVRLVLRLANVGLKNPNPFSSSSFSFFFSFSHLPLPIMPAFSLALLHSGRSGNWQQATGNRQRTTRQEARSKNQSLHHWVQLQGCKDKDKDKLQNPRGTLASGCIVSSQLASSHDSIVVLVSISVSVSDSVSVSVSVSVSRSISLSLSLSLSASVSLSYRPRQLAIHTVIKTDCESVIVRPSPFFFIRHSSVCSHHSSFAKSLV